MQETQETWVQFLGQGDPLEQEMAAHSSILDWKIPWTEESDEVQSMGSQRVGHDWATEHAHIHVGSWIHHLSQNNEQFQQGKNPSLPFYIHTHLLPASLFPQPYPLKNHKPVLSFL